MQAETLDIIKTTASIIMPIFCMILGWLLNALFGKFKMIDGDVKALTGSFESFRRDMPINYLRREDYRETRAQDSKVVDEIFKTLRRIEDKLDGKADKP